LETIHWSDFEKVELRVGSIVEVEDFPAFIIVDDKGNDFFAQF